jgi:DNA-binding transcriptional LysR family regulator
MDTELLKTFLAVEKARHFGRAAEGLYLTPAAISARIRQLESVVGAPLFLRHRNNVTLTAAGERLKPYAENILESWNRALQESSFCTSEDQQLAIGGTPNLWDFLLQDCLYKLREAQPELSLRAESLGSETLTAQLQGRRLDMAVLFDPLKLDEVARERVLDVSLLPVSTEPGHTLETALEKNYVQVEWSINFTALHGKLCSRSPRPALVTGSGRLALDYLLRQGGAAFLPETVAAPFLKAGTLHPVDAEAIPLSVYAIYREDNIKKPLLRDLVRNLKTCSLSANSGASAA